jgi:hypothetical protein
MATDGDGQQGTEVVDPMALRAAVLTELQALARGVGVDTEHGTWTTLTPGGQAAA